jgi:hypothetical protein
MRAISTIGLTVNDTSQENISAPQKSQNSKNFPLLGSSGFDKAGPLKFPPAMMKAANKNLNENGEYFYNLANEFELQKNTHCTPKASDDNRQLYKSESQDSCCTSMVDTDPSGSLHNKDTENAEEFLRQKLMGFKEKKNFVQFNRKNITPRKKSVSDIDSNSNFESTKPKKSPLKWEARIHHKKTEIEPHSFQPMLSKQSLLIAETLPDAKDRLYSSNNANVTKNFESIMASDAEKAQCTFTPKINQMSKYIDKKINEDRSDRCDQLYDMVDYYGARKELLVQRKKMEEEIELKNLSFKPHKTNIPREQPHFQVGSDIATRAQQWQIKKEEKIGIEKKKRDEELLNHSYAPKTVIFIFKDKNNYIVKDPEDPA